MLLFNNNLYLFRVGYCNWLRTGLQNSWREHQNEGQNGYVRRRFGGCDTGSSEGMEWCGRVQNIDIAA